MASVAREHWLQRMLVLVVIKRAVASDRGEQSKHVLLFL